MADSDHKIEVDEAKPSKNPQHSNSDDSDSNNRDLVRPVVSESLHLSHVRNEQDNPDSNDSDDGQTLVKVAQDEDTLLKLIAKYVTSIADEAFTRDDHLFRIGVSGDFESLRG